MTDYDRYTIRFGDLGGDTAVPDLAIEASGADPLAEQVLRFAAGRHLGRDLSVTVEDMRRGRVFAGMKVAGHFTITAERPDEASSVPEGQPGRNDSTAPGLTGMSDSPGNLASGVPGRTAVGSAQVASPEPAETAGRYVVARINKTYRTLGEHPGPQHVGKAFVPYDDRHLTQEAAEESARASNDRYRPNLTGKTHIPVRAEPIPGTNKFRNLDHPSLTGKVKTAARAAEIKAEAARYGLIMTAQLTHDFNPATRDMDGKVIDATVTVEGTFTPGDARAYTVAEANANTVLGMIRMVRPGSVWGTDSASVGGYAGMNKSGAEITVARHLAQIRPPTGDGTPDQAIRPDPGRTAAKEPVR